MPEATVDEYCDPFRRKNEIGTPTYFLDLQLPSPNSGTNQVRAQSAFRRAVAERSNTRHHV